MNRGKSCVFQVRNLCFLDPKSCRDRTGQKTVTCSFVLQKVTLTPPHVLFSWDHPSCLRQRCHCHVICPTHYPHLDNWMFLLRVIWLTNPFKQCFSDSQRTSASALMKYTCIHTSQQRFFSMSAGISSAPTFKRTRTWSEIARHHPQLTPFLVFCFSRGSGITTVSNSGIVASLWCVPRDPEQIKSYNI